LIKVVIKEDQIGKIILNRLRLRREDCMKICQNNRFKCRETDNRDGGKFVLQDGPKTTVKIIYLNQFNLILDSQLLIYKYNI